MGIDLKLMLVAKKLDGISGNLCIARIGRKWPLQRGDGRIEIDQDKLWPDVNRIEEELKKRVAFLVGYTPKDLKEAESLLNDLETDIAGIVEELVNYGRAILLANILHDSAGYIKTEDG